MLGVWKAGAAFTVVEDDYAPERIEAIKKDCGCRTVIDDAAWDEILKTEPRPGFRRADDHDACFAIYTSGSTGKPKGVLQEYGKIKLNQASLERRPGELINSDTCMAQCAPLNFIAAVKIFLNALYSGMRLVIFSTETARDPVRLNKLFDMIDMVVENHSMRIQTGVLNEIMTEAVAMQQPPADKGKRLKLFYMTQVAVKPPTFVIFVNDKELMHFSYTRYIENQIREAFGFRGTPLKFIIRERGEK